MFEFLFKYPAAVYSRGHYLLASPWPWWALLALIVIAACGLYWNARRHWVLISNTRAAIIWALQTALVALLLLLLFRPAISVATLRPQQNIVAVLLDSSNSMR